MARIDDDEMLMLSEEAEALAKRMDEAEEERLLQQRVDDLLAESRSAEAHGDFKLAIKKFREALRLLETE